IGNDGGVFSGQNWNWAPGTLMTAVPSTEAPQPTWPAMVKPWLRARTELANSVSSVLTALRTEVKPTTRLTTRMVAMNRNSEAIIAPASSFQHFASSFCMAIPLLVRPENPAPPEKAHRDTPSMRFGASVFRNLSLKVIFHADAARAT